MIHAAHCSGNEKGVALITVMLVFVIAAGIAMSMLSRQQLDIARTANLLEQTQAYQYALGAEELARQTLYENAIKSPGLDHSGQSWAMMQKGFPIENGQVDITVEDLQGKFNLNSLLDARVNATARFVSLLKALNIQANIENIREELATEAQANGLPPVAISPQEKFYLLADAKGLRALANLSPSDMESLLPLVTALPETNLMLNVNTAPDTVLRTYVPNDAAYGRMMDIRNAQGYLKEQQLRSIGMDTSGMGVGSTYFQCTVAVQLNGTAVRLQSVLHRSTDKNGAPQIQVISRDMSNF